MHRMVFRQISPHLVWTLCGLCLLHPVFGQSAEEEFVRFPESTFTAKRPGQIPGASARSIEQEITLSAFTIGATEVTQQSFERVMGYNSSVKKGPRLPVTNISWLEAMKYCNRRSKLERLEPCYDLATRQPGFPFWPSRHGQGTPIRGSDARPWFSSHGRCPVRSRFGR